MSGDPGKVPKLLVSVRSVEEARAAVAGGCDLLDLKEPNRGSLGAADRETIQAVCEDFRATPDAPPLSVALGELQDWADSTTLDALPPQVRYVKLGLSGCRSNVAWTVRWMNFRMALQQASGRPFEWIAVHYADAEAGGPGLGGLLEVATATGCRGLLVDTFLKDGRRLFDHVDPESLTKTGDQVRSAGLLLAVAGSLTAIDLPRLTEVSPDIIAVRGAVCGGGDRRASISQQAVCRMRDEIERVF